MLIGEHVPAVRAACIYCRLSYAPDGSLEKVERQEADCRALAERLGWPVCCVFSDNSKSAWQRNRKRPAWDRMLASLQQEAPHRHDAIIVYHGDRLIRQPYDLELLLRIADDRHIPLASPSGVRDLRSEEDRFILRIEAAQACKASADTSRRVRRGWKARAERGLPIGGGKRPFGYGVPTGRIGVTGRPVYDTTKIVEEEAAVLREAVQRLLAGESQGSVLRWMNSVSTTTQGHKWTQRSLRHLLLSPRIAGLLRYEDKLLPAAWPPIISIEEWEAVKALVRRRAQEHPYAGRERKWMLSGIARCGTCSGPLITKPTGGRNRKDSRIYYCPNHECPRRVGRNQAHLDAYVGAAVVELLNTPEFLSRLEATQANPELAAKIATLERRKAETEKVLENLADEDEVDPALLVRSISKFTQRIAELRAQLAADERQRLLLRHAGISWEQWESIPVSVRASVVKAMFRVIVYPTQMRGPGFDPSAVRLEPV